MGSEKCLFIPNGVKADEFTLPDLDARQRLGQILAQDLAHKKILLSVGHLVKRKGIYWFIQQVMPRLAQDTIYIVIGHPKGNLKAYQKLVQETELQGRVFLLGEVADYTLKLAYHSADLLIMPNIKVEGDMEGFGVVILEAGSCGLPAIASNIEGIRDVIQEGQNGFLVEAGDVDAYVQRITQYRKQPMFSRRVREYTLAHFEWNQIAKAYYQVFQSVIGSA